MTVVGTQRRLTSATAWIIALVALICGIVLLMLAELVVPDDWLWLRLVLGSLGAVICTSVVVGVLWELVLKREAMSEMYATVALSERVREAGLINVATDFQHALDWESSVKQAKAIDLFYAYSDRWRKNNTQALREAARNKAKVRLLLPDFRNDSVLTELASKYVRDTETVDEAKSRIRHAIRENIAEFRELLVNGDGARGKLDVWLLAQVPLVTLYRMDDVAVIVSYNQTGERNYVPVLVGRKGGELFEFAESELNKLMDPTYGKSEEIVDIEKLLEPEAEAEANIRVTEEPDSETEEDNAEN